MALAKTVSKYLLGFLGLWIALYFLARFSVSQSTAIALLATLVAYVLWVIDLQLRPGTTLVPHRILVLPHWDRILLDLGLVATPEEYDSLCESLNSLPPERYNVFRDGLCFTVLDSKQFGQRTLIYSDSFRVFKSEADFEESLAPLTCSREAKLPRDRTWHPSFFVEGGVGGYGFGVVVDESWWEKKRDAATLNIGKLDVQDIFDTNRVKVTLASIPASESTLYWKRSSPYPKGDEVWKKHREEDRARLGWFADETRIITLHKTFYELKHKYFSVRHHSI